MRLLLPEARALDGPEQVAEVVLGEHRVRADGAPWVVTNMVASLDGVVAVEGRSGGLGGPVDRAVFLALRAAADVILVGGGTARAEGYGPPRLAEHLRAARQAAGRPELPRLAVVTARLDLPDGLGLLGGTPRPLVLTSERSDPRRRAELADRAEVVVAGERAVTPAAALAALAERGAGTVLCEGGPSLLAALLAAGAVDELDHTVAPVVVGAGVGLVPDLPHPTGRFHLTRVIEGEGLLCCRYVRA